jgi:hypothetical protein
VVETPGLAAGGRGREWRMRTKLLAVAVVVVALSLLACGGPVRDTNELAFIVKGDEVRQIDPGTLEISPTSIEQEVDGELTAVDGDVLRIRIVATREGDEVVSRVLIYDLRDAANRSLAAVRVKDSDGVEGFEQVQATGEISRIPGLERIEEAMSTVEEVAEEEIDRLHQSTETKSVDASTGKKVGGGGR